jgi:hypothetical protein
MAAAAARPAGYDACEHGCLGRDLPKEVEYLVLFQLSTEEIVAVAKTSVCCKAIADGLILEPLRDAIMEVAPASRPTLYYMFMHWPRTTGGDIVSDADGKDPVLGWDILPGRAGALQLIGRLVVELKADDKFLNNREIEQWAAPHHYTGPEDIPRGAHPAGKYRWFFENPRMGDWNAGLVLGGGVILARDDEAEMDERIPNTVILAAIRDFNSRTFPLVHLRETLHPWVHLTLQSCKATTIPVMVRIMMRLGDGHENFWKRALSFGNWPNLPQDAQIFTQAAREALGLDLLTSHVGNRWDLAWRSESQGEGARDAQGPDAMGPSGSWRGNEARRPARGLRMVGRP